MPINNYNQIIKKTTAILVFLSITILSTLLISPFNTNSPQIFSLIISIILASFLSLLIYSLPDHDTSGINDYPYPFIKISQTKITFTNNSAKTIINYWQQTHHQDFSPDLKQKITEANQSQFTKQYTEVYQGKHLSFLIIPQKKITIIIARDASEELQADQMKSEFVSLASHQLRTPLTAIKWLVQRLEKPSSGTLNPKQLEITTKLKESSIRMINLVNDLLNISRIETGRMSIQPEPINLIETTQNLINELKPIYEERNQKFNYQIASNFPQQITTDNLLIKEVINNLLSNASKYSPDDTTINVSLYPEGNTVKLLVKDNGYGIPKEEQIHIFDRFYRASNVVTKDIEGTGLGLYMSKLIIKSLGGDIIFQSSTQGTVFEISLPISGLQAKLTDTSLLPNAQT